MLTRRGAALAALLVVAGVGITAGTPAFADTSGTTLYVNNDPAANCSDTGTNAGTQAQPYCTIQAAVNVVSAGQTVQLMPGLYKESVNLTRSGTADAPITIKGAADAPAFVQGGAYGLRVSGASNIVITSMIFSGGADSSSSALVVDDSHDVTVSHSGFNVEYGRLEKGTQIHVTGASTGVDIADDQFGWTSGSAIVLDGGGSGDRVRTNFLRGAEGEGISVDSVPGVDIVSNTIDQTCGSGIALTGTAAGATIENNIVYRTHTPDDTDCSAPAAPLHGIEVGPDAVSGTIENYNDVDTDSASVADSHGTAPSTPPRPH